MWLDVLLYVLAAALVAAGLIGAVLPALPGIPLLYAGIWLAAATDGYRHLGRWWLLLIALVGVAGVAIDLLAGALGAKRVGASPQAVWGATLGTVVGLFGGLPGLLLGPFLGALLGELLAGRGLRRSTRVGLGTWLGLIFGTLVKLAAALMMLAMALAGWWLERLP